MVRRPAASAGKSAAGGPGTGTRAVGGHGSCGAEPYFANESCSYSNLFHCDKDGVYLFLDTALKQLVQAMEESK